ncbi:immunity 49 family protein [Gordonia bronchialis]|uniref:immunity 49 family protein n=1 Tax=Gordonia bronchialis TaxID=2054 RepID=UPI00242E9D03|nr:immunity 49 family protein [Gordonia bronchialis]
MDVTVRHEVDPDYIGRRVNSAHRLVARSFELDAVWNSGRINTLMTELRDLCALSLVSSGGVTDEVWWALDGAATAALAQFERASFPRASRRLFYTIGGHEVATGTTGPGNMYTTASDWLNALWLGLVARDSRLLEVLRDFEVEWMVAAEDSGQSVDAFVLEWVRAWQMLLRGERGEVVARQVVRVMELTDPEVLRVAPAEVVLQLAWPSVRLLWDVVAGDGGSFAGDVRVALEGNKEFFTRPVEDRVRDPYGYLPWEVLGTVCAGVDSGFEVGVVSEYLPEGLLFDRRGRASIDGWGRGGVSGSGFGG